MKEVGMFVVCKSDLGQDFNLLLSLPLNSLKFLK